MVSIHQLLEGIRRDAHGAPGDLVVGYWDRLDNRLVRVPMRRVHYGGNPDGGLVIEDEEGCMYRVPLDRVRVVLRDGEPIWQRDVPDDREQA